MVSPAGRELLVLAVLVGVAGGAENQLAVAARAALAAARPGETVRLPTGTIALSAPLAAKSGVKLVGAGQDQTILCYVGDRPAVVVDLSGREEAEVAHLTIDGQMNPQAHQGLFAHDARRLDLHHLTIRNLVKSSAFGPHGMLLTGSNPTKLHGVTDSAVTDCTFENIGLGAAYGGGIRLAWGSSRNRVERCTFRGTGRGGIFGDNGSHDLVIRGNKVAGSGGEGLGIEVWGGCDGCVIEDNLIDHWLSIGGSDRCAVRRNTISAKDGTFKGFGIEAIGSDLVVTDNTVDDGAHIGLSVSDRRAKERHYYARNRFVNCAQWGAQLQGEAGGCARYYLWQCAFDGTTVKRGHPPYPNDGGHGFRTNGNCRNLVLEDCEFRDNAGYGLQLGGGGVDQLSFIACTIAGNGAAAVVGPGGYTGLEWLRCSVTGNRTNELTTAKPLAGAPPAVAIDGPRMVTVGQSARFTRRAKAADGGALTLLWDLGDGPPQTVPETQWTYQRPGEYQVALVVWDTTGRGARAACSVQVVAP